MASPRTSTTKKKTGTAGTKKPAAAKTPPAKTDAAETEAAEMAAAETAQAEDTQTLSRRELVNRVAAASGAKKPVVKQVVEAVLKELGDALSDGADLNLQPFGKASVKRVKEMPNAEVLMLKLRRNRAAVKAAESGDDEGLAAPAE